MLQHPVNAKIRLHRGLGSRVLKSMTRISGARADPVELGVCCVFIHVSCAKGMPRSFPQRQGGSVRGKTDDIVSANQNPVIEAIVPRFFVGTRFAIHVDLSMTTLTRDHLLDGGFRSGMPPHSSLTDEQLERSLAEVLAVRPEGPLWVFAYGSLIWNPLLKFEARRTGLLNGWRRSFCVRSVSVRGSEEWPGRVPGLERGGQVRGVAFRLRDDQVDAELRVLWSREMAGGVYHPLWTRVALDDGQEAAAITFVANVDHRQTDQ